MTAALKIESLTKKYGSQLVLNDIDLQVNPGEFVSLVGPSGCGKSTLLRVIAGLTTFEKGQIPLVLILDRITDVRNFGAIARTAECAGVHAIVIPARGAAQINADAMKTSSGALNFIPVCKEENLVQTIDYLQNSGLKVISCTEKTKTSIYSCDFTVPLAIILGSEEDGISDELIRKSDELAAIPQSGQVGSLNVSVATGVVIYEATRQRV